MKQEINNSCVPQRIPQRLNLPFLGHSYLLYFTQDTFSAVLKLASELGPIFRLKLGPLDSIAVASLELIKETCDKSRFEKHIGRYLETLRGELNNARFLSAVRGDEPIWGQAHRILLPGFNKGTLQKVYFPRMLDVMKTLFIKWDNTPKDREVNLSGDISRTSLDIMGLCAFNFRFNALLSEEIHPVITTLEEIFMYVAKKFLLPNFLNDLQFRKKKKSAHNVSILYRYVDDILEERKKQPDLEDLNDMPKDFLDLMLNDVDKTTGEKLDIVNIRDQIIGLLIAGAETSTGLLSFAFYNLMIHPDVLEKAYAEIDRVLGTDLSRELSPQDFLQLSYIEKILNECLRLWPPIYLLERKSLEDTLLGGKYPVKRGQHIWQVICAVHRDKAIWGKDADSFNPDRFIPEFTDSLDPYAFIPFSTGRRICPGRHFAMLESTIILSTILQRYRLHLCPGYQFGIRSPLTLQPHTIRVTLEKRNNIGRKSQLFCKALQETGV